ncbi:MAG: hypothetical protein PVG53_11815 [Holophagae bacterium]|jgi:hypothetical protein
MDRHDDTHHLDKVKKPYRRPRLSEHGKVCRLIQGGSKGPTDDHGQNMMSWPT